MSGPPVGHYRVRVSARARRARIVVSAQRGLEVVVPREFDQRHVPALLVRHRAWILRQLAELPATTRELPGEIHLAALDERWRVDWLAPGIGQQPIAEAGSTVLALPRESPPAAAARLRAWLLGRGRVVLPPWLASVRAGTGLEYDRVSVRLQRSRWGSCSTRGTISLNARLLLLPGELVRHVMIHELCHTLEFSHSPAFWRLVARFDPQWRSHRARLRLATASLPWWLHA